MEWIELYSAAQQPTEAQISDYIANPLWSDINSFLRESYGVEPSFSYSGCSGQPGWNVKYQKGGKSLCTLYPMNGFFIVLVVIGNKELAETELVMPLCDKHTRELFERTPYSAMGRWLMIQVSNERILEDAKRLIQIRRKIKQKARSSAQRGHRSRHC